MKDIAMLHQIPPYEEMLIKQRLDPALRHRVHPVVTEPLPCRTRLGVTVREAVGSVATLFRRRESAECCTSPSC
jgi:hypothetical protein